MVSFLLFFNTSISNLLKSCFYLPAFLPPCYLLHGMFSSFMLELICLFISDFSSMDVPLYSLAYCDLVSVLSEVQSWLLLALSSEDY